MKTKTQSAALPGFEVVHARLLGLPPGMMMDNGDRADPLDPIARVVDGLRKGTPTNKRTYKYHENLAHAGFIGALWTNEIPTVVQNEDDDIEGVKGDAYLVVPGNALMSVLAAALGKQRRGGATDAKSAVSLEQYYPLLIDGKIVTAVDVFQQYDKYARRIRIRNKRGEWVTATRPLFRDWECPIKFEFNSKLFDLDKVHKALSYAGAALGLASSRTRGHGRFDVEFD